MDHQGIEETDLVEAYVTGRLGEPERTEFEAHLVECPECLDRVEAAQGLGAGLRALGSPDLPVRTSRGPRRWAAAASTWAIAASVAAVVALGWGMAERRRLQQAIEAEQHARSAAEARAQELAQRPPEPREPVAPPRPAPPTSRPVPVLTLVATRGAGLPTLRLPQTDGPVVLWVERESPPRFNLYRVRLTAEDGAEVLGGVFPPGSRDAVVLAVGAGLLSPGTYALALEGEPATGTPTRLPGHRFRVVR